MPGVLPGRCRAHATSSAFWPDSTSAISFVRTRRSRLLARRPPRREPPARLWRGSRGRAFGSTPGTSASAFAGRGPNGDAGDELADEEPGHGSGSAGGADERAGRPDDLLWPQQRIAPPRTGARAEAWPPRRAPARGRCSFRASTRKLGISECGEFSANSGNLSPKRGPNRPASGLCIRPGYSLPGQAPAGSAPEEGSRRGRGRSRTPAARRGRRGRSARSADHRDRGAPAYRGGAGRTARPRGAGRG